LHAIISGAVVKSQASAALNVTRSLMALLSPLPVDVGSRLRALPKDGKVTEMPGRGWTDAPGNTPGYVSLWRESDRIRIAHYAFFTTKQESAYAAITQAAEMNGPPMCFTADWDSAGRSVEKLARLGPETVITGHGQAGRSLLMRRALDDLARRRFDEVAVPRGRSSYKVRYRSSKIGDSSRLVRPGAVIIKSDPAERERRRSSSR
jgi:glyoxylase-like metal-dependent hydrolase (beta-lactamase superfamily II)